MKGNTSAAVRAQHAPAEVERDDEVTALYRTLNFYPTPPWASRAVFDLIEMVDPKPLQKLTAWEPACGQGHMAAVLGERFKHVAATDVHPYGYGDTFDFLSPECGTRGTHCDFLITNPPFSHAAEFLRRAFRVARRGVAIIGRVQLLETAERFELMTRGDGLRYSGLTLYAPFCERVPMHLGRWLPNGSTASAYAWFLFKAADERGEFRDPLPTYIIPPGTKRRLTKPDDARRFGYRGDAPLLEEGGE